MCHSKEVYSASFEWLFVSKKKMNLQEEGEHKERLLITGATGFIGKYILEKAIELGFDVWVAVRKESG